jgi:hypothetical protein
MNFNFEVKRFQNKSTKKTQALWSKIFEDQGKIKGGIQENAKFMTKPSK